MKSNSGVWSVLCLVLAAVLAPTACILYFMNEAINNQRDVVRQKLAEAYRSELRLVQQHLDAFWEARAAALDRQEDVLPAIHFEQAVKTHLATTVICLGQNGDPAYPALAAATAPDPTANVAAWLSARALEAAGEFASAAAAYALIADREVNADLVGRALQAEIRCAQRSDLRSVLPLLKKLQTGRAAAARDLQGRLISADGLLLAVHMIPSGHPLRLKAAERLHTLAADYQVNIPAAQRLFLMEELRSFKFAPALVEFPTYDAERLAARYLEGGRVHAGDAALRLSDVPEIWKLTSRDGRTIALYDEQTVNGFMGMGLQQAFESLRPSGDVTFGVNSPGSYATHDIVLGGGAHMPGWQISLDVRAPVASGNIASRQRASYVWIGFLVIATLSVTALVACRAFLRQTKLARLKTDLVAAVSHELKTPLAAMSLLVDALLESPESDPVRVREYLELISRENERLSRLISNFLTFSRMERNRSQFEFARTDAQAVAQAAVNSIGDRFHVEVSVSGDLPPLYADEGALVTAVLNLLDNAFKYSGEPRRIELSAYLQDGRCCFAVSDNGIGIAPREQKKIFRRFYQVDRRLTSYAGGVGLGLSIVEFIVKAHGGAILVESRPGAGSRFVVTLPAMATVKGAAA
jgi:signal transduction histidine kinase